MKNPKNTPDEFWVMHADGTIRSAANQNMVISLPVANFNNGNKFVVMDSKVNIDPKFRQLWYNQSNGGLSFVAADKKCVDSPALWSHNTADDTFVQVYDCHFSPKNQRWRSVYKGDGPTN